MVHHVTRCLFKSLFLQVNSKFLQELLLRKWVKQREPKPRECLHMGACWRWVWHLKTHNPAASNLQPAASTEIKPVSITVLQPSFQQTKEMAYYPIPLSLSLSLKGCTSGKKNLQLFNKYTFIWSTDREKWRSFFSTCTPYDSNLGVLCVLARACGLW